MAERRPRRLGVWWNDALVAEVRSPGPGRLTLTYTRAARKTWPANTPLLSCSLPVGGRPLDATAFLAGLLPEGAHLQALASAAGVPTNDRFALLDRYGRDVAGALVISADPPGARSPTVIPYDDEALAAEVAGLGDTPLGVHADSELSIAGLQDKLLLVKLPDGRWGRPVAGAPSTHILKVDDDRFPGLVDAEAAALRLATAVGLGALEPRVLVLAGRRCLVVQRFDRSRSGPDVLREHQEDACQALGVDPQAHRGRAKYEDAGGPSWRAIAALLGAHAREPERELRRLVRLAAFTALVGNADAHGKNVALLHDMAGHVSLAPAYDTVPTVLWPKLRRNLAMAVAGERDADVLTVDHYEREASAWSVPGAAVRAEVTDLAEAAVRSLGVLDHDALADLVRRRAERLLAAS